MALIRWEPFREIDSLQNEMNRLFDSLTPTSRSEWAGNFVPPAEMHENGDAVYLKLEVPGIDAKNLDVQVTAEAVSISGQRQAETKTDQKGVTRSEFRYGKFQRVIPLPTRIQNDKVEADYKNGILMLTLPKAEAEKTKVVKVNIS